VAPVNVAIGYEGRNPKSEAIPRLISVMELWRQSGIEPKSSIQRKRAGLDCFAEPRCPPNDIHLNGP